MLQNIFVSIYDFFREKPRSLFTLFIASLLFWLFFALKISFKENISSMLPENENIKAMNEVISNTQAGEKIIYIVSFKDSAISDPDSLIAAVSNYTGRITQDYRDYIDTIQLQAAGEGTDEQLMELFQEQLPLFLSAKDFSRIDTLVDDARIAQTLEQNKKLLLSPASVVFKQVIAKDPIGISAVVWAKLQELRYDPGYEIYDGYLFANNRKTLTFFLKPRYAASETGMNSIFFKKLNQANEEWAKDNPALKMSYFGAAAVAAGNAGQMRTDTILTLSITVVALFALLYYFFRKKRAPALLLVPVLYGAVMSMAIVYFVQGSISVIALGAGAIVMGIAVNFSLHFLSHARHSTSVRETIKELTQPLTIGSFTTIAAFFALRLVHTPILQDFGLFAALSLAGAALSTLIFLPHFPLGLQQEKKQNYPLNLIDKLALWKPESNKWLAAGILLLTPFFLYHSFKVRFDSDLLHLNYMSPQLQEAQEEVGKVNAFAMSSIFVMTSAPNEDEALQKMEAVQGTIDGLSGKGIIKSSSNPTLFINSAKEQELRIQRWQHYWTEDKIAQVRASITRHAIPLGFNTEAFNEFYASLSKNYTVLDSSRLALLKTFYPSGFANKDKFFVITALKATDENRAAVFKAFEGHKDAIVTDRKQSAEQLVEVLNSDFNTIAVYSSLIVFAALLIGYGRIELTIISFLPMAISWIWILGLMALLGLEFNIVNIIFTSLIFGLGDDYSIFTTDGLIEKYKTGTNKLQAVRSSVYLSACTTIIGLGVLLLAKHPALKSIALISVLGILCVLFISQTLQPLLFNFFIQKRADRKLLPFTLWSFTKTVFAYTYFFTGSLVLTILGIIFTKLWPFNKEKGKYYFHVWLSRYTWSMMHIMTNVTKREYNREKVNFDKPAVYIANHSSFLDILITTGWHPKLVLLTNKWVWKSPVFGKVVQMAEYYPVAEGADDSIEPLKDLVNRGYSIIIFPEGTRTYTDKMQRFHKGAFYLAEKLQLDIVPVVLHGVGYTIQKSDFLLKDGYCSTYFYDRISPDDTRFGATYSERARGIGRFMRNELAGIKERNETPVYFKEQLQRSYTYKGPVLEWYCRIKIMQEGYYEQFHKLLPRKGVFYDLGCGYGFMTYMLHWAAPERRFYGVDYDEEKIETAQQNFLRDEDISFIQGDISKIALQPCNGIIISDVLHYLLPEQQEAVLSNCVAALEKDGILIVRDGVKDLQDRHKGTELTEKFSTEIFKFNKTQNKLQFFSREFIHNFAKQNNLSIHELDLTKRTSNVIFVMQKQS